MMEFDKKYLAKCSSFLTLAKERLDAGQFTKARALLMAVEELNASDPVLAYPQLQLKLLNLLASTERHMRLMESAVSRLDRCIEICEAFGCEKGETLITFAAVHMDLNNYEEAKRICEEAIEQFIALNNKERNSTHGRMIATCCYNIGQCCLELGKLGKAVQNFNMGMMHLRKMVIIHDDPLKKLLEKAYKESVQRARFKEKGPKASDDGFSQLIQTPSQIYRRTLDLKEGFRKMNSKLNQELSTSTNPGKVLVTVAPAQKNHLSANQTRVSYIASYDKRAQVASYMPIRMLSKQNNMLLMQSVKDQPKTNTNPIGDSWKESADAEISIHSSEMSMQANTKKINSTKVLNLSNKEDKVNATAFTSQMMHRRPSSAVAVTSPQKDNKKYIINHKTSSKRLQSRPASIAESVSKKVSTKAKDVIDTPKGSSGQQSSNIELDEASLVTEKIQLKTEDSKEVSHHLKSSRDICQSSELRLRKDNAIKMIQRSWRDFRFSHARAVMNFQKSYPKASWLSTNYRMVKKDRIKGHRLLACRLMVYHTRSTYLVQITQAPFMRPNPAVLEVAKAHNVLGELDRIQINSYGKPYFSEPYKEQGSYKPSITELSFVASVPRFTEVVLPTIPIIPSEEIKIVFMTENTLKQTEQSLTCNKEVEDLKKELREQSQQMAETRQQLQELMEILKNKKSMSLDAFPDKQTPGAPALQGNPAPQPIMIPAIVAVSISPRFMTKITECLDYSEQSTKKPPAIEISKSSREENTHENVTEKNSYRLENKNVQESSSRTKPNLKSERSPDYCLKKSYVEDKTLPEQEKSVQSQKYDREPSQASIKRLAYEYLAEAEVELVGHLALSELRLFNQLQTTLRYNADLCVVARNECEAIADCAAEEYREWVLLKEREDRETDERLERERHENARLFKERLETIKLENEKAMEIEKKKAAEKKLEEIEENKVRNGRETPMFEMKFSEFVEKTLIDDKKSQLSESINHHMIEPQSIKSQDESPSPKGSVRELVSKQASNEFETRLMQRFTSFGLPNSMGFGDSDGNIEPQGPVLLPNFSFKNPQSDSLQEPQSETNNAISVLLQKPLEKETSVHEDQKIDEEPENSEISEDKLENAALGPPHKQSDVEKPKLASSLESSPMSIVQNSEGVDIIQEKQVIVPQSDTPALHSLQLLNNPYLVSREASRGEQMVTRSQAINVSFMCDYMKEIEHLQNYKVGLYIRHINVETKSKKYSSDLVEKAEDFFDLRHPILTCYELDDNLTADIRAKKRYDREMFEKARSFIVNQSHWRYVLDKSKYDSLKESVTVQQKRNRKQSGFLDVNFQRLSEIGDTVKKTWNSTHDRVTGARGYLDDGTGTGRLKANATELQTTIDQMVAESEAQQSQGADKQRINSMVLDGNGSRSQRSNKNVDYNNGGIIYGNARMLLFKYKNNFTEGLRDLYMAMLMYYKEKLSHELLKVVKHETEKTVKESLERNMMQEEKEMSRHHDEEDSYPDYNKKLVAHYTRMINRIQKKHDKVKEVVENFLKSRKYKIDTNSNEIENYTNKSVINEELEKDVKVYQTNKKFLSKYLNTPLYQLPILKTFTVQNKGGHRFIMKLRLTPTSPQQFYVIETWSANDNFLESKAFAEVIFNNHSDTDLSKADKLNRVISLLVRSLVFENNSNLMIKYSDGVPDFNLETGIRRRCPKEYDPIASPYF